MHDFGVGIQNQADCARALLPCVEEHFRHQSFIIDHVYVVEHLCEKYVVALMQERDLGHLVVVLRFLRLAKISYQLIVKPLNRRRNQMLDVLDQAELLQVVAEKLGRVARIMDNLAAIAPADVDIEYHVAVVVDQRFQPQIPGCCLLSVFLTVRDLQLGHLCQQVLGLDLAVVVQKQLPLEK